MSLATWLFLSIFTVTAVIFLAALACAVLKPAYVEKAIAVGMVISTIGLVCLFVVRILTME